MKSMITLMASALLAGVLFNSCTVGPLEGDWFMCENDACTVLDDEGVRFTPEGRWGVLDAPGGSYEPGEPIELKNLRGSYKFNGTNLTLMQDGNDKKMTASVSVDGEVLVLTVREIHQICEPVAVGDPGPPTCYEKQDTETTRMKRVGDAGSVPVLEDGPHGDSTSPDVPIPPQPAP